MTRTIDFLISSIAVAALAPVFFIIGLMVKLDSRGPIFYRARRVGKDGKLFAVYKFRSMVVDADRSGPGITAAGDTRITAMGRFLRKTKLDELPQLLNVVKGDMSLVGPRPEDPNYVELYSAAQREILAVRPGITSAASLRYRHEEELLAGPDWEQVYRSKVLPEKLAIDLAYEKDRTLLRDLKLVLRTVLSMLDREPATPPEINAADYGTAEYGYETAN